MSSMTSPINRSSFRLIEMRSNFSTPSNTSKPPIGNKDLFPDELDSRLRLLFVVLYIIIIVLALGGNLLVFLVVAVNRKLRTVTNTFILSLAVSDILIASLNMPVQLLYYVKNEWMLGEIMCKLSRYLQGVVIVSSILTLTGIAVDRYYGICHPLRARHVHTVSRAVRLVAVFWVMSFVIVSPQLLIQRLEPFIVVQPTTVPRLPSSTVSQLRSAPSPPAVMSPRPGRTMSLRVVYSCTEYFHNRLLNIGYTLFTYIFVYVAPVCVMLIAYVRISHELRQSCQRGAQSTSFQEIDSAAAAAAVEDNGEMIDRSIDDYASTRATTGSGHMTMIMAKMSTLTRTMTMSTTASERQRRLRDKRVIVRMLVAIVLLFAVSWFPFFTVQVYVLWDDDAHRRHQSRVLMAVLQLFGYSNSATNSFVYCWFSENFQKHLVRDTVSRLICRPCLRRQRPTASTRVTSRGLRWPMAANSLDTPTACQSVALQSHHAIAK